jgi:hypothetical protein
MTPPTSPNPSLPTQNAIGELEPMVPGDSTDGLSSEMSSDEEEVPDSPLPQAAAEEHADHTVGGEEEDEDYKIVLRDSIRDEEEREARAEAYEENKRQNETVDDWLKAVSGVDETPPPKDTGYMFHPVCTRLCTNEDFFLLTCFSFLQFHVEKTR